MDPMECNTNAIIKQELIIDDLELNDYEHLLREFYCDQPNPDENEIDMGGFIAPSLASENDAYQNASPYPVRCAPQSNPEESESFTFLVETFDEEVPHPAGYVEDDLREGLSSSVIVKEEFVFEGYDETLLVDVLHSTFEARTSLVPKSSGTKRTVSQVKRPEYAQKCPVCKVWYHTEAGLESHLQRHHGRQLTDGKPREVTLSTPVEKKVTRVKAELIKKDKYPSATRKVMYCTRCDKTFSSSQKYKLHANRHTNIDSGRYNCSYCSKSLGSKQEQTNHETRKHQTIPFKESKINLLDRHQPCAIVLEDILHRLDVKEFPTKPHTSSHDHKQGRPKGSRRCPLCKQWFLTQDDLAVHFSIHNQSVKTTPETTSEINGQDRFDQVDAKHIVTSELKKPLALKSEQILNDPRKVGCPKGSLKYLSLSKVKSEPMILKSEPYLHERRKVGRPKGSRNGHEKKEMKEELLERRKVGRPKGSRKSLSLPKVKSEPLVLKSEPNLHEWRKVGRPKGSRNDHMKKGMKEELLERRKVGRPKGSRKCLSLPKVKSEPLVLKSEPDLHERRKVGRPKGSRNGHMKGMKEEPLERRKVGRPKKSNLSGLKQQLMRPVRRKVGRPKTSKNRPKNLAYCAKCDKEFRTFARFKMHELRHRNIDSGLFTCKPCAKVLTSKWELILHEQSGHKRKVGRPKGSRNGSLLYGTREELQFHKRRKVGRPKKSENCSKVNGIKQGLFYQIRRKIGQPKAPTLDRVPYCVRCDKNFSTHASFTVHKIRHRNIDLGLFKCTPCAKVFASEKEQVAHEHSGHKRVGRPSKNPKTKCFDKSERKRKAGRPQGTRKCPLCKVWFRSAAMFKDHIRSHIER